jgi:hypothetical protein
VANIKFPYMDCDERYVLNLGDEDQQCSICGNLTNCIQLNGLPYRNVSVESQYLALRDEDDLDEDDEEDKSEATETEVLYGCLNCLNERKFNFKHETEFGDISRETSPKDGLTQAMIDGMLVTPQYWSIYGAMTPTHCADFMVYRGQWQPMDYVDASSDGDGKALYQKVFREAGKGAFAHYTEDSYPDEPTEGEYWVYPMHAFKCRHCDHIWAYVELD